MIQKKICMLGGFGVGKTSLVSRFVTSIFSDTYLPTIGVKIDKKSIGVDAHEMTLMLWDIYGQDEFQTVRDSYLRGASGYLLVADGTRHATLETAAALQQKAESAPAFQDAMRASQDARNEMIVRALALWILVGASLYGWGLAINRQTRPAQPTR